MRNPEFWVLRTSFARKACLITMYVLTSYFILFFKLVLGVSKGPFKTGTLRTGKQLGVTPGSADHETSVYSQWLSCLLYSTPRVS